MWDTGRGPSASTVGLPRVGTRSSFSLESPVLPQTGARQTRAPWIAIPSQGCTSSKQPGPGQGSAADGEPVLTFRLLKDRASLGPSLFSPSDSPSRPATAADPEIQALAYVGPNLQIDVLSQGRAEPTLQQLQLKLDTRMDSLDPGGNSEGLVRREGERMVLPRGRE